MPVPKDGYWQIEASGFVAVLGCDPLISISITVLNTDYCKKCNSIVDTGTSLLAVPTVFANELNWPSVPSRLLLARFVDSVGVCSDDEQWEIDCKKITSLPDVTIVINGETYTLTGEQYLLQVTEQGVTECISGSRPRLHWVCGVVVAVGADCLQGVHHHLRHGAQPARLRQGCVDMLVVVMITCTE